MADRRCGLVKWSSLCRCCYLAGCAQAARVLQMPASCCLH